MDIAATWGDLRAYIMVAVNVGVARLYRLGGVPPPNATGASQPSPRWAAFGSAQPKWPALVRRLAARRTRAVSFPCVPPTFDPALTAHAGICAGGGWQQPLLCLAGDTRKASIARPLLLGTRFLSRRQPLPPSGATQRALGVDCSARPSKEGLHAMNAETPLALKKPQKTLDSGGLI
jgi:hypothetical protein